MFDDCSFWIKFFWPKKLGLVIPLPLLQLGLNFSTISVFMAVIMDRPSFSLFSSHIGEELLIWP